MPRADGARPIPRPSLRVPGIGRGELCKHANGLFTGRNCRYTGRQEKPVSRDTTRR